MLLTTGKIAGISGVVGSLLAPKAGDFLWRALFVAGVLGGGLVLSFLFPQAFDQASNRPTILLVISGLLVGFGTRLGNGCTSGHGVCGMSRFSLRSVVATMVFMGTGAVAAIAANRALVTQ